MRLSVLTRSPCVRRSSSLSARLASTLATDSSGGRLAPTSNDVVAGVHVTRNFSFGIRSSERPRQFAIASVARSKAATATQHAALDYKAFSSTDAMSVKAFNDATLTLDREYLAMYPIQRARGNRVGVSYREGYRQSVDRINDQQTNPHKHQSILTASQLVLKQFHSIEDFVLIMPRATAFFTHTMAAAMLLQDYEEVARCLTLYERCCSSATDPTIVHLAVNALLMQDKPADAWRCALRYTGQALDDTVRTREKALAATSMSCVVEYLKIHSQIARIQELLATLDRQHRLDSALSDYSRKLMLHAIVNDTAATNDDRVWQFVEQYQRVFPVRVNLPRFEMFIEMCMASNRWSLIERVLDARDTEHIPKVFQRLAVQISRHALAPNPSTTQLQVIARLADMTAISTFGTEDKVAFCGNVRRARDRLGSAAPL